MGFVIVAGLTGGCFAMYRHLSMDDVSLPFSVKSFLPLSFTLPTCLSIQTRVRLVTDCSLAFHFLPWIEKMQRETFWLTYYHFDDRSYATTVQECSNRLRIQRALDRRLVRALEEAPDLKLYRRQNMLAMESLFQMREFSVPIPFASN